MQQCDMRAIVWSYAMMVTNGNSDDSTYFAGRVMEWFKTRKKEITSITDLRLMNRNCFSKYGHMTKPKKILLDILDLLNEIGA